MSGTVATMPASGSAGASPVGINPLMPFTQAQMQANSQARALIKQQGVKIRQLVQSGSFTPTVGSSHNITMQPVPIGLVTGFCLEIVTTITNPSGGSLLTRTGFGPWNTLSSINYQNPSGFSPIQNDPGWHLASVMAGREKKIPGAAYTTDSPTGFGSVIQPIAAPSTITGASGTGTVSVEYEIPLAYAPKQGNFQGAVWAGTTLSNQTIQVTYNANFIGVGSADPINCVYTGASATVADQPALAVSWNLYQEYYDQFNPSLINYLTPDLSTAYYLSTQPFPALAPNTNNQIPFINLRTFLSLTLAYDNDGTFNAGTDINSFQLVSANQLPYWFRTISQQSWVTRRKINADFPQGFYYFDFRDDPIATQAQGNTYLNFNPSSVTTGAVLYAGWEYLAVQQVLAGAPSI